MLMLGLHIHQYKLNIAAAVLLGFKSVAINADEPEFAVRVQALGEVLLNIEIVLYKHGVYHRSFSSPGTVISSAKRGLYAVYISPPAASILRRRDDSPLPSFIGSAGTTPLFVTVIS